MIKPNLSYNPQSGNAINMNLWSNLRLLWSPWSGYQGGKLIDFSVYSHHSISTSNIASFWKGSTRGMCVYGDMTNSERPYLSERHNFNFFTSDWTSAMWFKTNSTYSTSVSNFIWVKSGSGVWTTNGKGAYFDATTGRFSFQNFGVAAWVPPSGPNCADGGWHYGVVSWRKIGTQLKIYTDGVLQHTVTANLTADNATHVFSLFALATANQKGGIDLGEIAVWQRTVSDLEVKSMYYGGYSPSIPHINKVFYTPNVTRFRSQGIIIH